MECRRDIPRSAEGHMEDINAQAVEKCIPMNVHLELTYRCNLRCVHCFCVEDKKRQELSYGEITDLLDGLAEAGGFYLTLSGGEVFTREDFFDIAFYAKKKHFATRIFTNGTLIDESAADRLAELKPLSVEFSLYATDPRLHEGVTGVKGSYERLFGAIELLRKRKITIFLKTTVMKQNIQECEGIRRLGKELGAHNRFSYEVTPRNDGSMEPLKYRLDEEGLFRFMSGDIPARWEYEEVPPYAEAVKRPICSAARNACAISPYGDVLPCVQLWLPLGNVRERPFSEIWNSDSKALSDVRSIKTFSDLTGCSGCEDMWLCRRCHGLALLESGDMRSKYRSGCESTRVLKMVNEQAKDSRKGG